jgi:hypothetical protein
MGFFGSLLGSDQKKHAKNAKINSENALKSGRDAAAGHLTTGRSRASADFTRGRDQQLTTTNTSRDRQLDATRDAYTKGEALWDDAIDDFDSYSQEGIAANDMYSDALGVNSEEERLAAQERYMSDPMFRNIVSDEQNAMLRNINARGGSGAGAAVSAGARIAYAGYGSWLDRLKSQAAVGFDATKTAAGLKTGKAGFETQYGDKRAGIYDDWGDATSNIYGAHASQQAGLDLGYANDMANLDWGYQTTRAGNAINYGNARSEASGIGVNNMMKIAELGVKAYTGMPTPK